MKIAPKIIVFTYNKAKFIEFNKDYENNDNRFYSFGGIGIKFDDIKEFLNDKINQTVNNNIPENHEHQINSPNPTNNLNQTQLTFEYINCLEKLVLPLFFKSLIDNASTENMEKYTSSLYNNYSKEVIK